jgi:hypothetical protein
MFYFLIMLFKPGDNSCEHHFYSGVTLLQIGAVFEM